MTDCDGEKVVTMMDVLKEQQEFEDDANAVLGASDDKECTYPKGYIKRQAIYACLTCCPEAKNYNTMRAGVCLACSLNCHENHELIELYTKRNFRCDCGNPKFNSNTCQYVTVKADLNKENSYNQNFSGLYCICNRPYPDPDCPDEEEMIQCIICEDWLHSDHLEAAIPSNDLYSEMICKGCMDKNEFLHDYSDFAVNHETESVDVVNVSSVDEASNITENGSNIASETTNEENKMDVDNAEENKASNSSEYEQNKNENISIPDDATSEANGASVENEKDSENIKEQTKSTDDSKPEDSENKDINESLSTAENHNESTKEEESSNINCDDKTIDKEGEKLTADEQAKELEQENTDTSSQEEKRTSDEGTSNETETKESTDDAEKEEEGTPNTDSIDDTKIESSENKTDNLTESVVKDDSNVNNENSTENNAVFNDNSKTNGHTEESPTNNDSEDKTISSENKRKLSTEQPETEEVSSKKVKLDEKSACTRPKGVKRRFKGATFWPSNFREKLCTCNECITMYKDLSVLFLIDPDDTVTAYENLGKEMIDGATSQYEKGLEALSSLDRIQQINALTEYNKMKDKLIDFLQNFKDRKEIVKEEDIRAFFAGMKPEPKREPDGVYFCR